MRALKEELDRLVIDENHLVIDVSSMTEGINQTSVEVELNDPNYEIMYVSSGIVNVTKLPTETVPAEGENGAEKVSDEPSEESGEDGSNVTEESAD